MRIVPKTAGRAIAHLTFQPREGNNYTQAPSRSYRLREGFRVFLNGVISLTEAKASAAIERVAESTLKYKDYMGIQEFFSDIWKSDHRYIVVLARRCFNLEYLFAGLLNIDNNQRKHIISNNAFLLYADQIASEYIQGGTFPTILIVDDLLIHGRGAGKLLFQFEKLVTDAIMEQSPSLYESKKHNIHWELTDAIDIYIYAVNKNGIILDNSFARKVKPYELLEESELKELSQRLSRLLERIGIPNTSYVISQRISPQELQHNQDNTWSVLLWTYHGNQYQFFTKCDCPSEPKLIATLRTNKKSGQNQDLPTWITSTTIWGNLEVADMEIICVEIRRILPQSTNLHCIRRILDSQQKLLQKQRAQLLSFILSACFLADFRGENLQLTEESDLAKVCRNFAKFEDIYSELMAICQNCDLLRKIREISASLITEKCDSIFCEEDSSTLWNPELSESSNNLTEDIFYEIGMRSEMAAYEIKTNLHFFHPLKRGSDTIQVKDFMQKWAQAQKENIGQKYMSISSCCIPSMLALMDSGLMSMNLEMDDIDPIIQTVLKAGEMALFSVPRRLRYFIPALALVERDFWRAGMHAHEVVKSFIEFLCATMKKQDSPDRKALDYLEQNGNQWVEQLYGSGQSFHDWEMDLSTKEDWMASPGSMNYTEYIQDEIKKQNMYLMIAKDFLGVH